MLSIFVLGFYSQSGWGLSRLLLSKRSVRGKMWNALYVGSLWISCYLLKALHNLFCMWSLLQAYALIFLQGSPLLFLSCLTYICSWKTSKVIYLKMSWKAFCCDFKGPARHHRGITRVLLFYYSHSKSLPRSCPFSLFFPLPWFLPWFSLAGLQNCFLCGLFSWVMSSFVIVFHTRSGICF